MKITVCQLPDERPAFEKAWRALAAHIAEQRSELVLLPELPFHAWFCRESNFSAAVWAEVVAAHERGLARLPELHAPLVLSTRAVTRGDTRLNVGYVWSREHGLADVHSKRYLPEEDGFFEASWYHRGPAEFVAGEAGAAKVGFAICTELWAMDAARLYSRAGIHLLATPRATDAPGVEKWITGARAAAIVSGAYSISSNRHSVGLGFGGCGWIIEPDGKVLATTSAEAPFVTLDLDLSTAVQAKRTYPRYALLG
ncbi:MAG: carbon-nitrogen hydrolase family protein [Opitutae bacterium]|nr:carbon-nitrogen hydrolase family protein [Opitutae bacterium]